MTKFITCLITFYLTSQLIIPDANAVIRTELGGTIKVQTKEGSESVSYTHLRAHET